MRKPTPRARGEGRRGERVLACSGPWALVEGHDGVCGWWRHMCSNPVTNGS